MQTCRTANPRIRQFKCKIGIVPHWHCFSTSGSWEHWGKQVVEGFKCPSDVVFAVEHIWLR